MRTALVAVLVLAGAPAVAQEIQGPPTPLGAGEVQGPPVPTSTYSVLYDARVVPSERSVHVQIELGNGARRLRALRFRIDPERHLAFVGEGELERGEDWVEWKPGASGRKLSYVFRIDHLRDERSYDARCGDTWAIFRGDDLVPPVRARTVKGAVSRSRLRLRLPEGWTAATRFARSTAGTYRISNARTRFDRPTGWIAVGELGVVREKVAGIGVTIAGPQGQGVRRHDWLALLRWTLPVLNELTVERPERLAFVGAGDPMWRGGLSGPHSVYLHASRPLIGEDGTSPLLHELVHAVLGLRPGDDGDWVVEGIAELYSLELMRRSGTIGAERFELTLERLERKARTAKKLRSRRLTGAGVARAVLAMRGIDAEIREQSRGARSLDDVLRELGAESEPVTTARFADAVRRATGLELGAVIDTWVP